MSAIKQMVQAFCEELEVMRSGNSMPYHKLALMVALVTSLVFSILLQHEVVFDGHIAVIDLDDSRYSQTLIQKLDSSPFIRITQVYHNPVDVNSLLLGDRNIGVLLLPQNLEKDLQNGRSSINIGYFADHTNPAQNGTAIETLNEVLGEEGAGFAAPRIAAMGATSEQSIEASISPMRLVQRRVSDPVYSATNAFVIAIMIFFCSLYLGLSTLMITGRLRISHQFERAVAMGPWSFFARLLPYVLCYMTGITLAICVLVNFGQMRFVGNYLFFLLTLFVTGMSIGMIALFLSWNCPHPGLGASFMILFVPPGFILGGSTMAIPFLNDWVRMLSNIWPLVWEYSFLRDIAQRGGNMSGVVTMLGWYLAYASVLGLLVTWRWHRSARLQEAPRTTDINELHFERP